MTTSDASSAPKGVTSESIEKLFVEESKKDSEAAKPVEEPTEERVEVELKSVLPSEKVEEVDCNPETISENKSTESSDKLAQINGEQVDKVSRNELVTFLEGFAKMLRKDGGDLPAPIAPDTKLDLTHPQLEEIRIIIEDKDQEIADLRRSLVEAQDTIIKLLTDRVEDRAKIASQDMELKLIPDLQEQTDRAMRLAYKTDELKADMAKVKYELDRNRIANVRSGVYQMPQTGIISRVKHWFLKAKGVSQRQFEEFFKVKKDETPE
ncbi:MAG: hypothetical protein KIT34_00500 [Cyanobacteria bacterium TGS_CYA1]|nr:hypothetical protein [Cyanobacteria bacterium TGS_CYA1]